MAIGKQSKLRIVHAIAEAEKGTTSTIHVHFSKHRTEQDAYQQAVQIFHQFGLHRAAHHNAVLFYLNLRKRKVTIIGDSEVNRAVGQKYWDDLLGDLQQDLKALPPDEAIARAIHSLGQVLRKLFPLAE